MIDTTSGDLILSSEMLFRVPPPNRRNVAVVSRHSCRGFFRAQQTTRPPLRVGQQVFPLRVAVL